MNGITTSTLSAETGFELAIQKKITWTVKKFGTVVENDSLIKTQELLIDVEECPGVPPTKWRFFLSTVNQANQYNLFNVPYISKIIEVRYAPNPDSTTRHWENNTRIMHMVRGCLLDENWKEQSVSETKLKEFTGPNPTIVRYGSYPILNIRGDISKLPLIDDSLVLQLRFNIYRKSENKTELKGNWVMPRAYDVMKMTNSKLLSSGEHSDVTIISKDGKEFRAHKLILRGNEVFDAMFRANMIEASTDIIRLCDMSSDAVKFLLHYIYTLEILPFSLLAQAPQLKPAEQVIADDVEQVIDNEEPQPKRSRLEAAVNVSLDEVLYLASKYGLGDLRKFAERNLEQWCDESNALYLHNLCKKYTLAAKDSVKTYIKNHPALLDELFDRD